jgi:hypothetical protein
MYTLILTLWIFNTQVPVIQVIDGFKSEQLCKDAATKWSDDTAKVMGAKVSAICVVKN